MSTTNSDYLFNDSKNIKNKLTCELESDKVTKN